MVTISQPVELRGIINRQGKNNNVYYMIAVEDENAERFQFYCRTATALPQGLKKGDMVKIHFNHDMYGAKEQREVLMVEKAENGTE